MASNMTYRWRVKFLLLTQQEGEEHLAVPHMLKMYCNLKRKQTVHRLTVILAFATKLAAAAKQTVAADAAAVKMAKQPTN